MSTIIKKSYLLVFLLATFAVSGQQRITKIESTAFVYKKIDTVILKLHIFNPPDIIEDQTYPAIVFFHGGGWNNGSYKAFSRQASYLASRGMIAISVEYRVKNRHGTTPWDAVRDAKSAMRFVRKNAKKFQIDTNMLAAGGGSAGGHLAAACGNIVGLEEPEEDLSISSVPNALVLFNPVYDLSPHGFAFRKFGVDYTKISPLHNLSKGAPPTVVFFGTKDKTTPVASSQEYKRRMEEVGSRCDLFLYEGQEHAFFNRGEYFFETLYQADVFLTSLGYLKGKPSIKGLQHD
jgi:acetyl esterase/lipase